MKSIEKYLVPAQAILFIGFLLSAFYFNRFAADDYHFIGELKTSSFRDIYSHLYYDWHGRWTSNFLLIYLIQFYEAPLFLFFYHLISMGLLMLAIHRLLKSINTCYHLAINGVTVLTYTFLFIVVLFFCTISANDTWFWYTSSVVYFWSMVACFFALGSFIKQKKNVLDYLLFGLSLIYIGGSNEPLTFFIVVALLLVIIKRKRDKMAFAGFALLGVSFLINYLSPGTLHRDEITPNLGILNLILYTGYSVVKYLLFSIHQTFIPALFLGVPFYLLGKKTKPSAFSSSFKPIQELLKGIGVIVLTVTFNQFIVVYALGGLAPDRSGIVSSIIICMVLVRYLFLLGVHHQKKFDGVKYILILNIVALIGFNLYFFKLHQVYSRALDQRIDYMINSKTTPIVVSPLPESGYLYSAEISSDPNYFSNQHLKKGLGLDQVVQLEN